MRNFKVLLLFTFGFLLLYSCSTNRQLYISGYKTSNKIEKEDSKQYASKKNVQNTKDLHRTELSLEENNNDFDNRLSTSTDNDLSFLAFSSNHKLNLKPKQENECDEIILKNGDELKGKVVEITETVIKYRKCDNLAGPIYNISKADVFFIKYPNGTRDVFVDNEKSASNQDSSEKNETLVDKKSSQDRKSEIDREQQPKKGSGLGTASFILSLLGLIFLIIATISPIGLLFTIMCCLLSLVSLIVGIVGVSKSNTTWGKVASIIGIIISTTLMLFVILALLSI